MMKKLLTFLILWFGIVSTLAFAQDETEDLTDYKTACLAAIDNISLIGNNFTIRSMISLAKSSLNICQTKDDMRRTMTALRAGVASYLQIVQTFTDGQVYTGLLGNHSFDTGDLSLWYCMGFDLSQVSLTDITNAMNGGDASGLVNAVSVNEWNEDTKAVENQGTDAIQNGHGKYYLNSTQMLMQPVIGLPAGIYSLSAKVACNPGLFKLNKVHLNALVVPMSVAQEVLGDVIGNNPNWEELLSNLDMQEYMAPFLENGKLYSGTVSCQSLSTFSDGELRFIIDKGDILVIGLNAGMMPFIGTEPFHADNLQLTGLRAANAILTQTKADLAVAIQGLEAVEANYNADLEGTASQPAFTYDNTLTGQYNQALLTAQDKYDNDGLADLLTKDNLNNLDGIDAALANHYSSEIQTLNSAKEAFDKQAFIAPDANEPFNIVMKDDWVNSSTPKWTGNAVSIDENTALRFSQKPGQSVFALAFCFERASDTYTNQLRAFVNDYRDKYYLGKRDGSLVLTTNPSEAVTITAAPSYTTEGEAHLMVGDMYLGTSNSSDALVETNAGTVPRPTRTGLAVLPASEMEISATIPSGWNAYTLMLPFNAELPEGVSAISPTGISSDQPYIEGEAATSLKANVPYIICIDNSNPLARDWGEAVTFSGVSHAVLPSYGTGLLIGRYTPYTTQDTNEYKLTVDEDGFNVFSRKDGQPIAENECYLKCDSQNDIIFVNQTDAATGIQKINGQWIMNHKVYNLAGQRLSKMQKGINIIGNKKLLK